MKIFICPIILTCLILSACATKTIEHNQAEIEILNPKEVTPYEDPMGIPNYRDMHLYYDAVAQTKIELSKIVDMMKKGDHSDSVEVFLMGNLDDGTQLINGIAPEGTFTQTGYGTPFTIGRLSLGDLESLSSAPVHYDEHAYHGMHAFYTKSSIVKEGSVAACDSRDMLKITFSVNVDSPNRVYISESSSDMVISVESPLIYQRLKRGLIKLVPWETPPW